MRNFFREKSFECKLGRVEVMPPTTKSGKKRVPYPYEGPKLFWVRPTVLVPLDAKASGVRIEIDCPVCKRNSYEFQRTGVVIRQCEWNGEKIFRIAQYSDSAATYIVESALKEMISAGFSNLGYIEAGVIKR